MCANYKMFLGARVRIKISLKKTNYLNLNSGDGKPEITIWRNVIIKLKKAVI